MENQKSVPQVGAVGVSVIVGLTTIVSGIAFGLITLAALNGGMQ